MGIMNKPIDEIKKLKTVEENCCVRYEWGVIKDKRRCRCGASCCRCPLSYRET